MVKKNMKSKKIIRVLLLGFVLSSLVLTACSGSGLLAGSSWPAVNADDAGHVFLAYKTELYAVDSSNGSLLWTYPEKSDMGQLFYSQPGILDDNVIAGTYNNRVHAINKDRGSLSWSFTDAKGKFIAGILVDQNQIFAPSVDHSLYALDSNGNQLWSFETKNALWAKPAADEDTIYLPSMDHSLYAVDRQNGTQVWVTELDGASIFSPVLVEDVLFVGTIDGSFYALNAKTGNILWSTKVDAALWSTPVVQNGKVFMGDLDGNVYAFDAETGSQIWKIVLNGSIISGAVSFSDGVVFPTENGDLVAVDESGNKLWTRSVTGKIMGTPIVIDDTLVFGVLDGDALMYAFDFKGNQIWDFKLK
jgi:outer membrane protein assembly factor BamB